MIILGIIGLFTYFLINLIQEGGFWMVAGILCFGSINLFLLYKTSDLIYERIIPKSKYETKQRYELLFANDWLLLEACKHGWELEFYLPELVHVRLMASDGELVDPLNFYGYLEKDENLYIYIQSRYRNETEEFDYIQMIPQHIVKIYQDHFSKIFRQLTDAGLFVY